MKKKKLLSLFLLCSFLFIGCGNQEVADPVPPSAAELNQVEDTKPTSIIYLEEGEKYSDGTYKYEELNINDEGSADETEN